MNASFKPSTVQRFYRLRHIGGSLALGLTALAGYVATLQGPPKTDWEWFVFSVIAAATVLKAVQSERGSNKTSV